MHSAESQFKAEGYEIVQSLLTSTECAQLYPLLRADSKDPECIWLKEYAATSRNFYEIGSHRALVDKIKNLYSEAGFILWGASFIRRRPGQVHHWHTDIESSSPEGGFVSVWIGLKGTTQASALKLIPGSHNFKKTIQEVAQEAGHSREEIDDTCIQNYAHKLCDGSSILQPKIQDGDAILFDGRLWHGSANTNAKEDRYALLLQYARSDRVIQIPDFEHLSWPFRYLTHLKAPCLLMSGANESSVNSIVDPPPSLSEYTATIDSAILSLQPEHALLEDTAFKAYSLLKGKTPNLDCLESHYSELQPKESPHPPHAHVEEEILIVIRGQATVTFEDNEGELNTRALGPGEGVFYPSLKRHTIYNHSDEPIRYLMFKWLNLSRHKDAGFELTFFDKALESEEDPIENNGFIVDHKFSGKTRHLDKLRLHSSSLLPGAGYEPHADDHDVALILQEGTVETLDQKVGPGELVWYAAGSLHGIRNIGENVARYLVIEFHGTASESVKAQFSSKSFRKKGLFKKRSLKRIMRNLKGLFSRN